MRVEHGRGDDAGRWRVHKELRDARFYCGPEPLEPCRLGIEQRGVSIFDVGQGFGRIEHFADPAEALHHTLRELRIFDKFLAVGPLRDSAEAAHPLRDISLEPDPPLLAIVDDVDPSLGLLGQHM
jgi:hypothetical protein